MAGKIIVTRLQITDNVVINSILLLNVLLKRLLFILVLFRP